MRRLALFASLILFSGIAPAQPVPNLEQPRSREQCNAFYDQYLRLLPPDVSRMTREQQDWHANIVEARRKCWQAADGRGGAASAAPAAPASPPAASAPATPSNKVSNLDDLERL